MKSFFIRLAKSMIRSFEISGMLKAAEELKRLGYVEESKAVIRRVHEYDI